MGNTIDDARVLRDDVRWTVTPNVAASRRLAEEAPAVPDEEALTRALLGSGDPVTVETLAALLQALREVDDPVAGRGR